MTMISQNVIEEIGLSSISDVDIVVADGNVVTTETYMLRLDIPISNNVKLPDGKSGTENIVRGGNLDVGKLPYNPANHDVLVGMDFIHHFHITLYSGDFILSN